MKQEELESYINQYITSDEIQKLRMEFLTNTHTNESHKNRELFLASISSILQGLAKSEPASYYGDDMGFTFKGSFIRLNFSTLSHLVEYFKILESFDKPEFASSIANIKETVAWLKYYLSNPAMYQKTLAFSEKENRKVRSLVKPPEEPGKNHDEKNSHILNPGRAVYGFHTPKNKGIDDFALDYGVTFDLSL